MKRTLKRVLRASFAPILRPIARRLAVSSYGRDAVARRADLALFRKPPPPRTVLGLILLGVSYTVGWPMIAVCAALSVHWGSPLLVVIGAPFFYGLSCLVFLVSMWLIGRDSREHMAAFAKWATRRLIETFAPPQPDGVSQDDSNNSP